MAMRIVFPRKGEVALGAYELPDVGPHDVRVRTRYSLMSTGTETAILHQRYDPDSHFARMFSFPQLKTGVQAVGEVEQVGSSVTEFSAGDRVYMREAHGSHQVLPATKCSPIPAGVDWQSACWAGLAKTAFRAAWAAPFEIGGSVLIIGAGPVGQMAVRWARVAGMRTIVVSDLSTGRLEHASRGGATGTLHGVVAEQARSIGLINDERGPGLVVDSTGNAEVFAQALAVAAPFGKVVLLGDTGFPGRQRLSSDLMMKGLTIQATHDSHDLGGWTQRDVDRLFFDCVLDGRFDLQGLITHTCSPAECEAAYALAERKREHTLGILFDWHA